jgi:quercetin 2,3-dioxygenase
VQMWVAPDESGITPDYQQAEIDDGRLTGGLVTIASGMHDGAAITIHNRSAALHGARLQPEDTVQLPEAPFLHLFVPRGEVTLEDAGPLHEGDAVRFTASGGQRVTATEPSEILVWEMHADLAGA